MNGNFLKFRLLTVVVVLIIFLNLVGQTNLVSLASNTPQIPGSASTVFLPIVIKTGRVMNVRGVETTWIDSSLLNKANGIGAYWWRYTSFSWKAIEPEHVDPAQYIWAEVNEQHLKDAADNGFSIVAVVKNAPAFAQKISGAPCGPIKDDAASIAAFKEFITALATRYSVPPFNIHYWQFGNEPDVSLISIGEEAWATVPFGCWGDDTDTNYWGGEYYGKFLKIFSETIKSVNPNAEITNGGLLLSCHPDYPANSENCVSGKFFEGMIKYLSENDGLDALDYASFHAYNSWYGGLLQDSNWASASDHPGILVGKAHFLREVMANYGINPVKPLLVTESGLMCRRDPDVPLPSGGKCTDAIPPSEFSDDQADYIVWLYVRAIALDITGAMWYTLGYQPYRHVGLLYSDGNPKPAYTAYQFLYSQLGNAQYVGVLNQYSPTLQAYEFTKGSQRIWVMWSPDQLNHTIDLPPGFLTAYDRLGSVINLPPNPTEITIKRPIYLILN